MAVVSGVLLHHVHKHPAQRHRPAPLLVSGDVEVGCLFNKPLGKRDLGAPHFPRFRDDFGVGHCPDRSLRRDSCRSRSTVAYPGPTSPAETSCAPLRPCDAPIRATTASKVPRRDGPGRRRRGRRTSSPVSRAASARTRRAWRARRPGPDLRSVGRFRTTCRKSPPIRAGSNCRFAVVVSEGRLVAQRYAVRLAKTVDLAA